MHPFYRPFYALYHHTLSCAILITLMLYENAVKYCLIHHHLFSNVMQIISEMLETPYYIHYSPTRMVIHKTVTSKYFDLAISAVIGLNVITMAMEFYMMPRVRILSMEYLDSGNEYEITCSMGRMY